MGTTLLPKEENIEKWKFRFATLNNIYLRERERERERERDSAVNIVGLRTTRLFRSRISYEDVSTAGEGQQKGFWRHPRPLSRGRSLLCHTCCYMGIYYGNFVWHYILHICLVHWANFNQTKLGLTTHVRGLSQRCANILSYILLNLHYDVIA